eukprot:TRINITY_DN23721_c0_g1_i4.p12 TRINITY_DN23721_c0_g1~~TRINITY_DN23721_c0_g1_i4.p12  ORF type:complete len:104 (+),score=2.70 TRINITY_DN23721_c0_g1_i4:730-1041(+)
MQFTCVRIFFQCMSESLDFLVLQTGMFEPRKLGVFKFLDHHFSLLKSSEFPNVNYFLVVMVLTLCIFVVLPRILILVKLWREFESVEISFQKSHDNNLPFAFV